MPVPHGPSNAQCQLMFSITIHERIEIVCDQIDNILQMCPGSRIVLHINKSLHQELPGDLWNAPLLRRLRAHPDVLINPTNLATRWAHMFHAHISNIDFLVSQGAEYDYLVMLSSADIIIRPGLAEYALQHDMGVNDQYPPGWFWRPKVEADPISHALQALSGRQRFSRSAHEGTYYRRAIVERMVGVLHELVTDWDYNDQYPKEEIFFPTLSFTFPDARRSPALSYLLGFNPGRDATILRHVMNRLGLAEPAASPVLARWFARGVPSDAERNSSLFVISRVPRQRGNLLRMLLSDATADGASDRARALAFRLQQNDIATFDQEKTGPTVAVKKVLKSALRSVGAT